MDLSILHKSLLPFLALLALWGSEHRPLNLILDPHFGKLPLAFEPNVGQFGPEVRFVHRGRNHGVYFVDTEVLVVLNRAVPSVRGTSANPGAFVPNRRSTDGLDPAVVHIRPAGVNPNVALSGRRLLPGKNHYFLGNDPAKWTTNVPTYESVVYSGVYEGVDLEFYGHERELEYDFVVAPGVDPSAIRLAYEGADGISIDRNGDLILRTSAGEIRQRRPLTYQMVDGVRRQVEGRHVLLSSGEVGFEVGRYDRSRPLIVDPVLTFSTFLGGTKVDVGFAVDVDSAGNSYVAGSTFSPDIARGAGGYGAYRGAVLDAFVTKVDPTGSRVLYTAYIGGDLVDFPYTVQVDSQGRAYLAGITTSYVFPTTPGAYQRTTADTCCWDGFVTALSPSGSELVFSTILAGTANDTIYGLALGQAGQVAVTGETVSLNFPKTPNAIQTARKGNSDAFVTVFNAAGSALVTSTLIGGSSEDVGASIAVDAAGGIHVVGGTNSSDFPTTAGAFQVAPGGNWDAVLLKLDSSGSRLLQSTYLGGGGDDYGNHVGLGPDGSVFVAGSSESANFPTTASARQAGNRGGADAFVARLNPTGNGALYVTLLGGTQQDSAFGIALDSKAYAFVVGHTASTDFPTTADAVQPTHRGAADGFITVISPTGSVLVHSTYLGGTSDDRATDVALDSAGYAYVTGATQSRDWTATPGVLQSELRGTEDAFLAKLSISTGAVAGAVMSIVSGNSQSGAVGSELPEPLIVEVRSAQGPVSGIDVTFTSTGATLNPKAARTGLDGRAAARVTLGLSPGAVSITASASELNSVTFTATASQSTARKPIITSVANGASFQPGIAPGSWVSIFGSNLAPVTRIWRDDEIVAGRLPASLDGVAVTINGRPASVYFISPTQLNVQAPDDTTVGPVRVEVTTREDGTGNSFTAELRRHVPGFFMFEPESRRYLASVHTDGAYVAKPGLFPGAFSRAAEPGKTILLFGTGFGLCNPPVASGRAFSGAAPLAEPVNIRIGGVTAAVTFSGLVGAGLYQFNVVVPSLPDGDHQVEAEVGGVRTQAGAYITIGGPARP